MKKIAVVVLTLVFLLGLSSCDKTDVKDFATDTFYFSLTWGVGGQSSYDSQSGTLIKTTDCEDVEEFTTTLKLDEEDLINLYDMVMHMDIGQYPDMYDPYNAPNAEIKIVGSKPPLKLILTVETDTIRKTIECSPVLSFGKEQGYNEEAQEFLDLCNLMYERIISSEEWKALPEYEILYE